MGWRAGELLPELYSSFQVGNKKLVPCVVIRSQYFATPLSVSIYRAPPHARQSFAWRTRFLLKSSLG